MHEEKCREDVNMRYSTAYPTGAERIALLSNVTVEVLAKMLEKDYSVWTPPGFGSWMETALAPPESLVAFDPSAIFILLDRSRATFAEEMAGKAKAALENAFANATVAIPDLEDLADETGSFYDERMWKLASMPWSMNGLCAIRDEIARLLRAMSGARRKVLALDFDGTLWSGAVGEDGVDGIEPYRDFQLGIKKLKERGVVLAGLSANNAEDVAPVWEDGRMVLGREDFSALRIDWADKPSNLVSMAKELNLGTDAFVFIDDNPAERERMKSSLPEVAVPDFPRRPGDLRKFLRRVERTCFPEMRKTREDLARTALYRDEASRRAFARNLTVDDYLKGLEMRFDVHPVAEGETGRVAQLSQKTNQFNVLANRYSAAEISAFANDPKRLIVSARAGDRFGDQGLVAFVHVALEGETAEILDWAMSCRTMNRRLEFAIEDEVESLLAARGVRLLRATWRRTAKNSPVENLFESFGFSVDLAGEKEKRYSMTLPRKDRLVYYAAIKRQ